MQMPSFDACHVVLAATCVVYAYVIAIDLPRLYHGGRLGLVVQRAPPEARQFVTGEGRVDQAKVQLELKRLQHLGLESFALLMAVLLVIWPACASVAISLFVEAMPLQFLVEALLLPTAFYFMPRVLGPRGLEFGLFAGLTVLTAWTALRFRGLSASPCLVLCFWLIATKELSRFDFPLLLIPLVLWAFITALRQWGLIAFVSPFMTKHYIVTDLINVAQCAWLFVFGRQCQQDLVGVRIFFVPFDLMFNCQPRHYLRFVLMKFLKL